MPSMVVTARPATFAAGVRHDFVSLSSTNTEHAPHVPVSHPRFVPVKPSTARSTSTKNTSSGISGKEILAPLSVKSRFIVLLQTLKMENGKWEIENGE